MPPLKNLRQETFCLEAVKTNDYAKAYVIAGYKNTSENTRGAAISQLLKNSRVSARLEELRTRVATRVEISAAKVLNELARLGTSDLRKVVGRDGCIVDPSEWDDDMAACVSSIKTEKLFEGKGPLRKHIGYTQELKLWDKNTALTNLAKHFKLLGVEAEGGDTYNTQMNFYLPSNDRDQNPEHQAHALGNGHVPNGSGD